MESSRNCSAIVLAAGQGRRMGAGIQKQFLMLGGKPVLCHSLACFDNAPFIQEIILVTGEDMIPLCREIVSQYGLKKIKKIVPGGKERHDSVYQGLLACDHPEIVFIHDGARPFITEEILKRGLDGALMTGAACTAVPSKDTIKISDENGNVVCTPDRKTMWIIQTPQVFRYDLIRTAHEEIRRDGEEALSHITDDAMVVELKTDTRVKLTEGSYENIKITTPVDLQLAEAILAQKKI